MRTEIIVPTYNRPDLLLLCLRQFLGTGFSVTVVDNGSDAETPALCVEHGWKRLGDGTNHSFSRSLNWAAEETDADVLFLLNNDAICSPYAMEAMLDHVKEGSDIVGALILDEEGVNHAGVSFGMGGPYHLGRGAAPAEALEFGCRNVPAVTFAAAMVLHSLWDDLDGLDEGYWYGYEDSDFCLRALEQNVVPLVCVHSSVFHNEKTSRGTYDETPNQQRFAGKWMATGRGARATANFKEREQ